MITSGSPTKRFEICCRGTYFSGIWFRECGGHVPGHHNSPFYRGCRPGGLDSGGRARPRVTGGPGRLAGVLHSVGPGCCPGHRRQGPPRSAGASPPGPRGNATSTCGGHGGVSAGGRVAGAGLANPARWGKGGRRVAGAGHANRARWGKVRRRVWRARPLLLWGLPRAPTWTSHPGGGARGAAPREAMGRPCQCTGAHKSDAGGGRTGRPLTTGRHRVPFASRIDRPSPSVPNPTPQTLVVRLESLLG